MPKVQAKYETIIVLKSDLGEEATKELFEKFTNLIGENGAVDSVEEWGKRRLAYPIQDETEGVYYLVNFTCPPGFPAELDRVYKITEGVLRTLIVAVEEK